MKHLFRHIILLFTLILISVGTLHAEEEKESLDVKSFIFGHTSDGYCFHITEFKGEPVCVCCDTVLNINEKEDDIGFVGSKSYLLPNLLLEDIIATNHPASSIDD